jgi:ATP-dependent Clp protease ATP-binding subunit ClpA
MFERFTDRSRKAVVLAQQEARTMNHLEVGPEHLLIGLASEDCGGVATRALAALGAECYKVMDAVDALFPPGKIRPVPNIPFSPALKRACEDALREALALGHNYLGTEHLLLGLIRPGTGSAAQVIDRLGLTLPDVRAKVLELLGGYEKPAPVATISRVPVEETDALTLAQSLQATIADLDGYIERRAAELAKPAVEEARADADGKVRAAEADAQRWKDCNTELERQILPLRQRLERSRAESRQNAEIAAAAISRADGLERELAGRDAAEVPADGS